MQSGYAAQLELDQSQCGHCPGFAVAQPRTPAQAVVAFATAEPVLRTAVRHGRVAEQVARMAARRRGALPIVFGSASDWLTFTVTLIGLVMTVLAEVRSAPLAQTGRCA